MLIRCPYCTTEVFVSSSGQCPACRKQLPPELVPPPQAAPVAPPAQPSGENSPSPTQPLAIAGSQALPPSLSDAAASPASQPVPSPTSAERTDLPPGRLSATEAIATAWSIFRNAWGKSLRLMIAWLFALHVVFWLGGFLLVGYIHLTEKSILERTALTDLVFGLGMWVVFGWLPMLVQWNFMQFFLRHARGEHVFTSDVLHDQGFKRIAWAWFASLAFLAGVSLGVLALIVPAILFVVCYGMWPLVAIDQRTGAFKAFALSARITRGHRWQVALLLLFNVLILLLGYVLASIGQIAALLLFRAVGPKPSVFLSFLLFEVVFLGLMIGFSLVLPVIHLSRSVAYLQLTGQPTAMDARISPRQ